MKKHLILSSLLALAFSFGSCSKESEPVQDISQTEVEQLVLEQIIAEQLLSDFDLLMEDEGSNELLAFKTNSCLNVYRDTSQNPPLLIFDFGPVNCMGLDSNLRRGQIIMSQLGTPNGQGWQRTIRTRNFFFNDHEVIAHRSISQRARNGGGNPSFDINSRVKVLFQNGSDSCVALQTRSREFTKGFNTQRRIDDEFSITGTHSFRTTQGRNFNARISKALIRTNDCPWIRAGEITLTSQRGKTIVIDFGNGRCDRIATLSFNGRSKTIRL